MASRLRTAQWNTTKEKRALCLENLRMAAHDPNLEIAILSANAAIIAYIDDPEIEQAFYAAIRWGARPVRRSK